MNDFLKRFMIACTFMILIGVMIIGAKAIHADTTSGWVWPVKGIITSSFGARGGEHKGIDIAAPMGTPVVAAKAGTVKRSYYSTSYGNVVFILHPNGDETVYAHLEKRLVHKGDTVKQGQEIGEVGSTGDSTGPHLHFEVHHGLWNVNKTHAFNPLLVLGSQSNDHVMPANGDSKKSGDSKSKADQQKGQVSEGQGDEAKSQNVSDPALTSSTAGFIEPKRLELLAYSSQNIVQKTIVVKKGDTLWGLAHQYDVPVSSIKKWNQLSTNLLEIGQSLVIYPDMLQTYQVKSGDSLGGIAQAAGISVDSLIQLNHLQGQTIYPSEILITAINS